MCVAPPPTPQRPRSSLYHSNCGLHEHETPLTVLNKRWYQKAVKITNFWQSNRFALGYRE